MTSQIIMMSQCLHPSITGRRPVHESTDSVIFVCRSGSAMLTFRSTKLVSGTPNQLVFI